MSPRPPISTLFPYTTLFRSARADHRGPADREDRARARRDHQPERERRRLRLRRDRTEELHGRAGRPDRSEEHTSELQSLRHLVCRLLLEKKKQKKKL